jgi:thiol-disulfide isomerase/thioredoxin
VGLLRRRTPPSLVTFVTRKDCHLCEQAEPLVARAAEQAGVPLELRDVDVDIGLRGTYSDKVPVVLLDGVEHAYWRIDERALRAALRG